MLSANLRNNPHKNSSVNKQAQGYLLPVESVLLRVQAVSKKDAVTTYQVCQIIAQNPLLQYDIISVANAMKKSSGEIINLYQAVMFLGLEKVESVIASRVALIQ